MSDEEVLRSRFNIALQNRYQVLENEETAVEENELKKWNKTFR